MSGPQGEADEWGQRQGPVRTSGTATLALATGVLSFFCLFGFGGVMAIALGWLAHGEIERAQGGLAGKRLASTGIGLGIANLIFTVVGVGALVALAVRPEPPSAVSTPPVVARPLPPPAVIMPPSTPAAPRAETADATPALPVLPAHIGTIVIVEAASGDDALETQLLSELKASAKAGERLVLWTVTSDCEPCDAVGRSLSDPRMQRALAKVRLVRANAAAFPEELRRLGIAIDVVPGFTLLDARGRVLDHIHGGEWDADIPGNIAPILDKFVRRSLTQRRHPWARPLREGETPL